MADTKGLLDFGHEESDDLQTETDTDEVEVEGQDESEKADRSDEELLEAALTEDDYEDEVEEDQNDVDDQQQEQDNFKNDENARNAERRRQNEQRMMERLRNNLPEVQLAQQLSQLYGKPVDQLMAELREAQIEREARAQGVPVEVQRRISEQDLRIRQLETQTQMSEFMQWNTRIDNEMSALSEQYPMLSQDDLVQAKDYLLGTLQNTEIPLKQAVLALHGERILAGTQELAQNEALAQVSGRKVKSTTPPKSKSSSKGTEISAEESLVAKEIFGMSEEDYLKYK